ncbi:hypothetical protein [Pseudomonas sp.]|uniref:hypothetical protein n=1 Tax=Pseudomonas sp. TaxID=306 RepID=UPI003D09F0AF
MLALDCDNAISSFSVVPMFMSSVATYAPRRPRGSHHLLHAIAKPTPVFAENLAYEMKEVISSFGALGENWDGYGAIPVNPQTVENSKSAANLLFAELPVADIFPNPNGTITFEWDTDKGIANLEIGESRYSFYIETKDGDFYPLSGEARNITRLIPLAIAATIFEESEPAQTVTNFSFFANDFRANS